MKYFFSFLIIIIIIIIGVNCSSDYNSRTIFATRNGKQMASCDSITTSFSEGTVFYYYDVPKEMGIKRSRHYSGDISVIAYGDDNMHPLLVKQYDQLYETYHVAINRLYVEFEDEKGVKQSLDRTLSMVVIK